MSTPTTPDAPSFLERSKKAIAGGVTGAVSAGSVALTSALADGAIDGGDGWLIAGAVVGGFAVGFASVWAEHTKRLSVCTR